MKPHKHEKFIKLKAEGLLIERKAPSRWVEADWCSFDWADAEFRIAPNQPADEEGWIPWFGGKNPVPGKMVDYKCITATYSNTLSERLSWSDKASDGDITHYRVVKEKVNQPADEEGWIPWFGGKNPAVGKMVDYECLTATGSNWPSEDLVWSHWGSGRDINRYRIHKEKVKQKVKKWRWMFFYPAPIQPSSIYVSEPFTEDEAAKYFDGSIRQRVVPEWKMEVECDE